MRSAIIVVLLFAGCSLQPKPDPVVEMKLDQHTVILNAITAYIGDLQDKGVLPKPEPKET